MAINTIIYNIGSLATVAGHKGPARGETLAEVGLLSGAALAIEADKIVAVGTEAEILAMADETTLLINAEQGLVTPGLVDPHTHLVYGGDRAYEWTLKQQGVSYLEILAQGGGILSTVRQTRQAGHAKLKQESTKRLQTMLQYGTTTAEAKSGYGLDLTTELLQLDLVKELNESQPVQLVSTFMAAHAFPEEYAGQREAYVNLIIEQMLPQVADKAAFCDVFCEEGVFTVEESRKILLAAAKHGMRAKLHADELAASGGSLLAAELKAISADHLLMSDPLGHQAMATAGVIGVCLPATSFYLAQGHYAPARSMLDEGMAIALATDANPGSSPTENMQLVISIACLYLKLTPAEALVAATLNSAHAIGLGDSIGSLEAGKQADIAIFDVPSLAYLPYHFGVNQVKHVLKRGKLVF